MKQLFRRRMGVRTFLVFVWLAAQCTWMPTARARQWKARTGSFETEGEFVAVKNGKVYLEKKDGSVLSHPVRNLCDDDCDYLRSLVASNRKLRASLQESPLPTRHSVFLSSLKAKCQSLDFSPDGRMLAVGTSVGLSIVDLTEWTINSIDLKPHGRGIYACRFNSGSDKLLIEDHSRQLRTWTVESPTKVSLLKEYPRLPFGFETCAFMCDRKRVLNGGRNWSLECGVDFRTLGEMFQGKKQAWFVNPKGTQALGTDGKVLILFELETGKAVQQMALAKSHSNTSSISPSGQLVATAYSNQFHLWNILQGERLTSIDRPSTTSRLMFAPDSESLIGVCHDFVRIFRVSDGELIHVFQKADGEIKSTIAVSPQSKYIATSVGTYSKNVQIFRVPLKTN
jgi:WD40 repeat protein